VNKQTDEIYVYDGSLSGFYCCVFESVYSRATPRAIQPDGAEQMYMFSQKYIPADREKADRVRNSIPVKISDRALELVEAVFLSCMQDKETALLRFLLLGYKEGRRVTDMLSHPDVSPVLAAERHLMGERHLLTGFIRFADYGDGLAATITPKNFVLPFLAGHFIARFPKENFMIFDKTHKAALIYQDGKAEILPVDEMTLPEIPPEEAKYQALWKSFYNTIAIEARYNPKCRMTHMPKRYWGNMTEFQ